MSTVFDPKIIHYTSQYQQIKDMLIENQPTLIIMHHSIPQEEMSCIDKDIRKINSDVRILLLLSHPQQISHFASIFSDGIIYDDFSESQLKQILITLFKDTLKEDIYGPTIGNF